ncbi:MAG: hypothetical protein KIT74_10770 [Fimbriimonadales bacterium]|nr:hypothetical protein [Fimbriimonadales bacterium]
MALFKLGAFADYLSGKSGNTVFARTKSGTVVRDRVIPTNPNTGAQQFVRGNMTDASQTFRGMTALQVQAWNQYGKTQKTRSRGGKLRTKNGINAFCALATKFLQVNPSGAIPLNPPTAPFHGDNLTLTATAGTGNIQFSASADNSANVKTEILLQTLASPNRKPQKGAYKSFGFYSVSTEQATTINVPTGYYAAAYRFVNTLTGQDTPLVYLPVQTVALSVTEHKPAKSSGKKAA